MKTWRKVPPLFFARVLLAVILLIALLALNAQPVRTAAAPTALELDWYANAGTGSYNASGNLSLESSIG